jgi:hypothetical protein
MQIPCPCPLWSLNFAASIAPTVNCAKIIWKPPTRKSFLRPNLSTIIIAMMLANVAHRRVTTAERRDALSLRPIDLTKERDQQCYHKLWPVLPLEYVPELIPTCPRVVACRDKVIKLVLNCGCSTQLLEQNPCLFRVAITLDYEAWCLREEDCTCGQQYSRDCSHGQGYPPSPSRCNFCHEIINDVCKENAQADSKLKTVVDCPTVFRWRHF